MNPSDIPSSRPAAPASTSASDEAGAPRIEYYFSFISLWSYVGSEAFLAMARRHGARIVYKPVDLMAVFAATDGKPVKQRAAARQAYRLVEMQRWRDVRGIDLVLHPRHYPADPSLAHRVLLGALAQGAEVAGFVHACLRAVWADELDIAEPATIHRLAQAHGLDADALLAGAQDPALLRQEADLTAEAIRRQVFGAPFYFYREEPFWGQDRLDMLEARVQA